MSGAPEIWIGLVLSALAAGVINSVAGGGTLLTFPSLLAVVSPVVANATSTTALVTGSLAGAWGYRREMRRVARWVILLATPSLVGGVLGALLVTRLPPRYFGMLVPWLILAAAVLFLIQPQIARLAGAPHATPTGGRRIVVVALQFLVAVYGGYFGAGIGILMLSVLGLMGLSDIHEMNAVKTLLAALINGVSVIVFVVEGEVRFGYAAAMAVAAVLGGFLGAHYARRMNRTFVRWLAIAIGFGLALYYFYVRWFPTTGP